jgi:4-hydroxybenzoate polyprenyltransferase
MLTFAVYTLNLITDKAEDIVNRGKLKQINKQLLIMSVISISLAFLFSAFLGVKAVIVISTPLLAGILYSVKIFPKIPRVKEVFAAKSIIVAFSWGISGALLPFILEDIKISKMFTIFLYVFIEIFIGTVLSDVLDMKGDFENGIKTIPLKFGIEKTKMILLLINTFLIPLFFYVWIQQVFIHNISIFAFGIAYGYFMIFYFCTEKRSRIMFETIIDGMFIPQLLLLVIFSFSKV